MENPHNTGPSHVPPHRNMAVEEQARIGREIDKQMILLCNLRAQWNSFSLIFCLPPETLGNIFVHGARDHYENVDRSAFHVPRWVNVSYVCRHWRDVALNYPTLWSYHFVVSHRWTDELLARSKRASLKIRIISYPPRDTSWWSSLVEKLMNHMDRVQDFRVRLPASALANNLSLRAPRLQNLEITAWGGKDHDWSSAFINRDTPALRTLSLSECPLPWYLRRTGLTRLSLAGVPFRFQLDAVEFLAVLSHMQDLTDLRLQNAFASTRGLVSGGSFNPSLKIELPCLARLSVCGPLSTVVVLLSSIVIPPQTDVILVFGSELESSVDDYALVPPVLSQRFRVSEDLASSSLTIRSLVIASDLHPRFIFSVADPPFPKIHPEDWACSIPLRIMVVMDREVRESNNECIISDICSSVPSTNIQNLHVVDPPFTPVFWRRILEHLQGLRYLKLSNGYMPDLASVLSAATDESAENTDSHVSGDENPTGYMFARTLEKLELHHITFSSETSPSEFAITKSSLLASLSTRDALRDGLIMFQCHVDHDKSDVDSWGEHSVYDSDSSGEFIPPQIPQWPG